MKNIQTSTCLKKKYTFPVLDLLEVTVEVTENPYMLPLNEFFTMAARINKKRSFLFVSKLIGKHLPIHPNRALITSALLGLRYYESIMGSEYQGKANVLDEFSQVEPVFKQAFFIPAEYGQPLIIGFAETATSLGQAFFDCFSQADYFHTTREVLNDQDPVLTFEEEHSHATSHRCYLPLHMIQNEREVILVDDELTTGKTALNIIRSIHAQFPRKKYTVAAILDWRSAADKAEFTKLEKELAISITVISLLAGTVHVDTLKSAIQENMDNPYGLDEAVISVESFTLSSFFFKKTGSSVTNNGDVRRLPYIHETGRFGLHRDEKQSIDEKVTTAARYLLDKRIGKRTLCLGTGEFMYLPLRIAAEMGEGVSFHSTTRSPIFAKNTEGYGARYHLTFPNPEDRDVPQFVYNIPPLQYDELFIFFEREPEKENLKPLLTELKKTGIQSIKLVFFSEK